MRWIPNQRLRRGFRSSIFILTMHVKGSEMKASLFTYSDCAAAATGSATAFSLNLRRQTLFSVPDAANVRIACVEGIVWITLDNDPRDIVLESCGVFTTTEHRRALVYAMEASRITVAAPAATPANAFARRRKQTHGLVLQMEPA
jgi:Protein of unknown function (DUF2917)